LNTAESCYVSSFRLLIIGLSSAERIVVTRLRFSVIVMGSNQAHASDHYIMFDVAREILFSVSERA